MLTLVAVCLAAPAAMPASSSTPVSSVPTGSIPVAPPVSSAPVASSPATTPTPANIPEPPPAPVDLAVKFTFCVASCDVAIVDLSNIVRAFRTRAGLYPFSIARMVVARCLGSCVTGRQGVGTAQITVLGSASNVGEFVSAVNNGDVQGVPATSTITAFSTSSDGSVLTPTAIPVANPAALLPAVQQDGLVSQGMCTPCPSASACAQVVNGYIFACSCGASCTPAAPASQRQGLLERQGSYTLLTATAMPQGGGALRSCGEARAAADAFFTATGACTYFSTPFASCPRVAPSQPFCAATLPLDPLSPAANAAPAPKSSNKALLGLLGLLGLLCIPVAILIAVLIVKCCRPAHAEEVAPEPDATPQKTGDAEKKPQQQGDVRDLRGIPEYVLVTDRDDDFPPARPLPAVYRLSDGPMPSHDTPAPPPAQSEKR